jgi:hypothetical protein
MADAGLRLQSASNQRPSIVCSLAHGSGLCPDQSSRTRSIRDPAGGVAHPGPGLFPRRVFQSAPWRRMAKKFKIAASSRARLRSRPSANWKLRIMQRILLRDRIWRVESATRVAEDMTLFRLFDPTNADRLEALCPPEEFEPLAEESPSFSRNALAPFASCRHNSPVNRNSKVVYLQGFP